MLHRARGYRRLTALSRGRNDRAQRATIEKRELGKQIAAHPPIKYYQTTDAPEAGVFNRKHARSVNFDPRIVPRPTPSYLM